MANLRGLLDKHSQTTLTEIQLKKEIVTYHKGVSWTHKSYCGSQLGCCDAYGRGRIQSWCTPPGTTSITFHVWGAGGGGPGACCCMGGTPGGSGAYAKKTIAATPGDCYTLCAGMNGLCCSRTCLGCRGCQSWVTGNGLVNFCADGGHGGKGCCFIPWNPHYYGATNRGTWEQGTTPFDRYGYDYFNHTPCASYYGADCGALGRPSFIFHPVPQMKSSGDGGFACWLKAGVAFPGGLMNTCGGHITANLGGNACIFQHTGCSIGSLFGKHLAGTPGVGGLPALACGQPCCHAYSGGAWGPGMVRIDYY